MASFDYEKLLKEYNNFVSPKVAVLVEGKNLSEDKNEFAISDVEVEMSSGYEAGMATFWIHDCYDTMSCAFNTEGLEPYIRLGSQVTICLGYDNVVREIFCGFIARVNFEVGGSGGIPGVEVTVMDAKGIMMANNHSQQLKAQYYSDAVSEIFRKPAYNNLKQKKIITDFAIENTPDKPAVGAATEQKTTEKTIEMVGESDYEFVVKAAKKFNFDFFIHGGKVIFCKAKSNPEILMEFTPETGIRSINMGYDITGLTAGIEVRCLDVGKGKLISSYKANQNKISHGNHAKALLSKSKKVYVDPTTSSKADADNRLDYLMEDMTYRFGSLELEVIGIPEIIPGRFVRVIGFGGKLSNTFYVQTVRHCFSDQGYVTKIIGKAKGFEEDAAVKV